MFCSKCGNEINDEAVVCTNCGCAVNGANHIEKAVEGVDIPSGGLNVLAFFVPLAGLIMFCIMIGKTPRKAKQIGIFAIIGFVINFIVLLALGGI